MKFLVITFSLAVVAYAHPGGLSGSYLPSSNTGFVSQPSGSYLPGLNGGGSSILSGGYSGGGGFGGGGFGGGNFGGGYSGGFAGHQDQRHVFFYAAPDDEPAARFRVNIAPSSHRNTKIIFVKAPSSGGVIPEVIAPPSQAEDKTLVYVLVKKQQQGGAITIPSSLGVKQAKPEVYFIKYRNQADAEQAVLGGLNGQSVGAGLSDLGNEGAFVRTLSTHGGGIGGGIGGGYDGGIGGIGGGGIVVGGGGYDGGYSSGSSILGGSIGGVPGGVYKGSVSTRYGTPGASGPYKR